MKLTTLSEAKRSLYWAQVREGYRAAFSEAYSFPKVFLPIFVSAATIYGVLMFSGGPEALDQANEVVAGILALLVSIPVAMLVLLAAAMIQAPRRVRDLGDWHGNEFIYHQPQRVFATRIQDADHGRAFTFRVPHAPGDAYMISTIEFEPENKFWNGLFMPFGPAGAPAPERQLFHAGRSSGHRLHKGAATLTVLAGRERVASTLVRVVIHSWSVGPTGPGSPRASAARDVNV